LKISEYTKESRIVIIDIEAGEVGVIVDAVTEVLRIPKSSIEPASSVITNTSSNYLWGIAKLVDKLIILIDPNKALTSVEEEQLNIEAIIEAAKSGAKQKLNNKGNGNGKSKEDEIKESRQKDLAIAK
jgi:purine-binding chemotaxis protein CheW